MIHFRGIQPQVCQGAHWGVIRPQIPPLGMEGGGFL